MGNDCPYCRLDRGQDRMIVEGGYTCLYIHRTYDGYIVMYAVGEDRSEYYYPNYCPACGRELNENA